MRAVRSSLVLLFAAAAACDDDTAGRLPLAPVDVAPDAVSAYVAVSTSAPTPGSDVVVSVRARRGSQVKPIGSFTLRIAFDTTRLVFKDAARSSSGMVMANGGTPGLLIAAGASPEGFADDELLSATFTARTTDALATITLMVQELNTIEFADQRSKTNVARGLFRGPLNR